MHHCLIIGSTFVGQDAQADLASIPYIAQSQVKTSAPSMRTQPISGMGVTSNVLSDAHGEGEAAYEPSGLQALMPKHFCERLAWPASRYQRCDQLYACLSALISQYHRTDCDYHHFKDSVLSSISVSPGMDAIHANVEIFHNEHIVAAIA